MPMQDAAAQVCSATLLHWLKRMRTVKASSNMWCCLWTALTPYKSFGALPSWNLVPFLGHDRDVSLSTNLWAVMVEAMPIAERSINSSQNDAFGACIHGAGRQICLWNHPAMRLQRMVAWFIVKQVSEQRVIYIVVLWCLLHSWTSLSGFTLIPSARVLLYGSTIICCAAKRVCSVGLVQRQQAASYIY